MRRRVLVAAVAAALVAAFVAAATAGDNNAGFKTKQPSMLTPVAAGATVTPIITVGDKMPGGYRFEAIPDGISIYPRGEGRVDVFVNHETSSEPFPQNFGAPTEANSQGDFDNAQLSHLILNQHSAGVLSAKMAIRSSENFQRFCVNYLATEKEGFDRPILFTNEEAEAWFFRTGNAWPGQVAPGTAGAEQAGVVVAYDVKNGKRKPIYGMGRHNHENSVAVPGYDQLVVLSGDDTFRSNPAQSQFYAYVADDVRALWNDEGTLYAFKSDDPGVNDYYDFPVGSSMSVSGEFIPVPKDIATGKKPDGSDLMAADKGYPAPPPGTPDGPQWVLETWGDLNGVFEFIRIEDTAYDKRPGMSNVHYLADSGRGATSAGGNAFTSSNGRIWKMELDPSDPTRVLSLSVLIEGDDNPVKAPGEIHQPDNMETTANGSLLIQEDPGSSQQFNPGDANATTGRIWRYDLGTSAMEVVARIDQSADEGPTDVDSAPAGRLGAWESSGVVDVSSVFGPGSFLVTVQAHTLWIEKAPGPDFVAPAGPDFTLKREGGQLVLLRVPGA